MNITQLEASLTPVQWGKIIAVLRMTGFRDEADDLDYQIETFFHELEERHGDDDT